jgi:iron(II)-dependent oxidoreductase
MTVAAPSRIAPDTIADQLLEARARTLLLVAPLSDEDLHVQHDPLMSPILWDLGHIAHFEELWLTQNLDGPNEFVEMPGLYNPFEHPRSTRGSLALPGLDQCRAIMDEIRGRVLARLVAADFEAASPLLRDGFVYQMVLQHEYQHNETILQTLQLKRGTPYTPLTRVPPESGAGRLPAAPGDMVRFPGGPVRIGTDDRSAAYDNERPAPMNTR